MKRNETAGTGDRLAPAAVGAVERVSGVAFPRPGIADPVRASCASRDRRRSGVRVRPGADDSWHSRGPARRPTRTHRTHRTHRTLDVTRAVREAVPGVVAEAARSGSAAGGARCYCAASHFRPLTTKRFCVALPNVDDRPVLVL